MVNTLFDTSIATLAFDYASHNTSWTPEPPRTGRRTTKIVVTAGPSCHTKEQIRGVIAAGANVFRLNFSHADHAWHAQTLRTIREVAAEVDLPIAVMQDLCGPKIRLSYVAPGKSKVVEGQLLTISSRSQNDNRPGTQPQSDLAANYPTLVHDVEIGSRLLLDDGRVTLEIVEKRDASLVARVVRGGILSPGKGINLPGVSLSAE
ncbi:MAG: pyruvate kinase, partial [Pirellulales bacterium]